MRGRDTIMKTASPTLHATVIITVSAFVMLLVLAFVIRVEVVARGKGRIIPVSRVQVVQPEFSGRIIAIHVRNGSVVGKGDVLVELDSTDALAELGKLTAEQRRLNIEMLRIGAMLKALALDPDADDFVERALRFFVVPEDLSGDRFTEEQRILLAAETKELAASFAQIAAREKASRHSEEVTSANIARLDDALKFRGKKLKASKQLLERGAKSRTAYLDVLEAYSQLEREREIHERELQQKIAQRLALDDERRQILAERRASLVRRQAWIDARLATLAEEERAVGMRVRAATLRAPVSGVVDRLQIHTIGGVAKAGDELLRIVPTNARVEVEGFFSNRDIGFIKKGQKANIRLDAYPSERFGFIRGLVFDIAADSTEITEDEWGYVVRVRPLSNFLEAGGKRFRLRPGMTARVDVITEKRRLISYFFAPIVKTVQDALSER